MTDWHGGRRGGCDGDRRRIHLTTDYGEFDPSSFSARRIRFNLLRPSVSASGSENLDRYLPASPVPILFLVFWDFGSAKVWIWVVLAEFEGFSRDRDLGDSRIKLRFLRVFLVFGRRPTSGFGW